MEQSEDDYHQQEGKLATVINRKTQRLNVVLELSLSILSISFIGLANQSIELCQTCVCCVVFGLPIIASQKMVGFINLEVKEFIITLSQ